MSVGKVNTKTAWSLLEYDLLTVHAWNPAPDVVINAYSTNDMHILTMNQAQGTRGQRHSLCPLCHSRSLHACLDVTQSV
jgi:hypothetical protein